MADDLNSMAKKLKDNVAEKETAIYILQIEKGVLEKRVADLGKDNLDLRDKIKTLQIERPKLSSDRLISSFGDALDEMQKSLESKEGKIKYFVSNFEIDLKANVTYSDDKIYYQLPKLEDVVPFENLSNLRFNIKAIPKIEKDIFEYNEIPDLLGLKKEEAGERILKNGFKVGEIKYEHSNWESDTVLDQLPSPFSLAPPESPVDLTLSQKKEIKVPSLIGLPLEEATQILDNKGLRLGEVTKRASESPDGTVISQSITADEEVEIGTPIDLVLAETELSKVPKLLGLLIEKAKDILKEDGWRFKVDSERVDDPKELKKSIINEIIRQTPPAGDLVKKEDVEIQITAILAPFRVMEVEGIGRKYTPKLEKAGINTIGELSASSASEIAKAAGVSERVAKDWKAMASLHNDAYSLTGVKGIGKDEAELLVKAGNIRSVEDLKKADASKLYKTLEKALATKKVRVPMGFSLDEKTVSEWVEK
ncbi:MAG: DUF4332 domain-containing protein [Candidatus Hydrothermarchaeaceae archaeon]